MSGAKPWAAAEGPAHDASHAISWPPLRPSYCAEAAYRSRAETIPARQHRHHLGARRPHGLQRVQALQHLFVLPHMERAGLLDKQDRGGRFMCGRHIRQLSSLRLHAFREGPST